MHKLTLTLLALAMTAVTAKAQTTFPAGVIVQNGTDLTFKAPADRQNDAGDLIFKTNNDSELCRLYTTDNGSFHFTNGPMLSTRLFIDANGNIGIGHLYPGDKLAVNGKIRAKEVKVETQNWPDYVFRSDYKLASLPVLEAYISKNGHLPEVPNARSAEQNGIELGEMNKLLLKKIEELTLHVIELDKTNKAQQRQLDQLLKKDQTPGTN